MDLQQTQKPVVLARKTRHGHRIKPKEDMMSLFIGLQNTQIKTLYPAELLNYLSLLLCEIESI